MTEREPPTAAGHPTWLLSRRSDDFCGEWNEIAVVFMAFVRDTLAPLKLDRALVRFDNADGALRIRFGASRVLPPRIQQRLRAAADRMEALALSESAEAQCHTTLPGETLLEGVDDIAGEHLTADEAGELDLELDLDGLETVTWPEPIRASPRLWPRVRRKIQLH